MISNKHLRSESVTKLRKRREKKNRTREKYWEGYLRNLIINFQFCSSCCYDSKREKVVMENPVLRIKLINAVLMVKGNGNCYHKVLALLVE